MVELCRVRHDRMIADIDNKTPVQYETPSSSSSSAFDHQYLLKEVLKGVASGKPPAQIIEGLMKVT
jgi:hypothetical protein